MYMSVEQALQAARAQKYELRVSISQPVLSAPISAEQRTQARRANINFALRVLISLLVRDTSHGYRVHIIVCSVSVTMTGTDPMATWWFRRTVDARQRWA